jgi:serine acetyltransferase
MEKIRSLIYYLTTYWYYKLIFKEFGVRTRCFGFLKIEGSKSISLGKQVYIGQHAWLAASSLTGNDPLLIIKDNTYIGNFSHIYCTSNITIGKKVLIADKVYISDNLHGYENVDLAILDQPIKQLKPISVGDGAWIGENVCIIGASIGKNSVVGANSVVTKDIPDYSIAVGSPAKVIKYYNFETKSWDLVNK